jgi:hexosaminidase
MHFSTIHLGLFVAFLSLLACQDNQELPEPAPVALIPKPNQLTIDSGYFIINRKTVIGVENEQQMAAATHFADHFESLAGWAPEIKLNAVASAIKLTHTSQIAPEGYHLKVATDNIDLKANDGAGFFYGLQTLTQLLPPVFTSGQHQEQWAIPAVTIEDSPAFGWRGFMLDVSRHFFDKEQVMQILDMMARLKMNRFHWHLTDDQGWRIEIKSYPKLTEIGAWRVDYTNYDETISDWWGRPEQTPQDSATYGGFYTQEDIREIVAYAKDRFIEIIPEIDMPGHAQATIAAYPQIGCVDAQPYVATGGVFKNNTYNPGKEETFEFVESVLDEVMELFPFDYIHIGGDECNKEQWKKDPYAQKRIEEEGLKDEAELQSYFIKRVESIINKRGKKMIGWDEILEGGLAPNATVMSWRGEEGGIKAAQAGHDVIMTPASFCYLDLKQGPDDLEPNLGYSQMFLKDAYQYQVIPESFTKDQANHVLGTQANLWTESITDWGKLTYMVYPRVFAIAENAWTDESQQQWDDFVDRLDPYLQRLDYQGIRYATSAFNVDIQHRAVGNGIEFTFETEANHLDYFYTLDGTDPDTSSLFYTGPFIVGQGVNINARAFGNGVALGKISSLSFPIHLAQGAKVQYFTPYLDFKDAAGPDALVDYNYASLSISDDNWQGFGGDMEVLIQFPEPRSVSQVQITNLRFTISGVYVPKGYQILGSMDGKTFEQLREVDLTEASHTQGRNKVFTSIQFPASEVISLKVKAQSLDPIPEGHHRAGQSSRMYLDEIVVL